MLILGEVCTGLLRHSTSVSVQLSGHILRLRPGEPIRWSTRPVGHAVSADLLTGVDCPLPTGTNAGTRAVGTVRSRAILIGGRVLQGSAHIRLVRGEAGRRLPWSHYLARPGVVESIGRADPADVTTGFLAPAPRPDSLDLATVATRTMNAVQDAEALDRRPPVRTARTRLRWLVEPVEDGDPDPAATVSFAIDGETRRTLTVRVPAGQADRVLGFCEDLALHDWLLTVLMEQIERSQIGARPPAYVVGRLRPAIEQLLHLWMPKARLDPALEPLWAALERRAGLSAQWRALVDRVRDQIAINNAIAAFSASCPAAGAV